MEDWVQFAGSTLGTLHLRNPRQKTMTLCHRKVEWFNRTPRVPAPVCTVCASKAETHAPPPPTFENVFLRCPACNATWFESLPSDESIRKALSKVRCPGATCLEIGSARLGRRDTLAG
jgi:hypothetical protein